MKTILVYLITLAALTLVAGEVVGAPVPPSQGSDTLGWRIDYDDEDRITRIIDPAGRPTRIDYEFDDTDGLRRLAVTAADGSAVIRAFDDRGRLDRMADGAGTVTYGYDDLDRLNRVQRDGMPAVRYTYDTLDRIKTLAVGDFYRIDYTYDFLGRLAAMDTPAGKVSYEYLTGQGKVVRTLPNGIMTIWEHSAGGQLRQITHGRVTQPRSKRYQILAEYTYQYRPDGLIEAIKERSGAGEFLRRYQYDKVGRLVRAEGPAGQAYAYSYDAVGNRVKAQATRQAMQAASYDWAGRVTDIDGKPVTHDAAGNLTEMTVGGRTLRYRYNHNNQLIEIPDRQVSYRYDGDGRLIGRRVGGKETTFIPDPLSDFWKPLVMQNNGGRQTLMVWDKLAPLMIVRNGKAEFLLHDHLGSVRMVTDHRGRLKQRMDYGPFGASNGSMPVKDFSPRFAGLFWEPAGSVYLTRARIYSPQIGRFMQIDPQHRLPLGLQRDVASYTYCGNDPANYLDLDGLAPFPATPSYADWNRVKFDLPRDAVSSHTSMPELEDFFVSESIDRVDDSISALEVPILDAGLYLKSSIDVVSSLPKLIDYSIRHDGDPAAVAMQISFALKTLSLVTPGSLSKAFSETARLIDAGTYIGSSIRSRVIQNRALDLVRLPLGQRIRPVVRQELHIDRGSFTMKSPHQNFSAQGEWTLEHRGGASRSRSFAKYNLDSFRLHSGGIINQSSVVTEDRIETADSFFRKTRRYTTGRQVFNGAAISKAVEEWNRTGVYDPGKWEGYHQPQALRSSAPGHGPGGPGSLSSVSPSKVGGVYLGGAGQALSAIGLLEGIAFDENNNLILLNQAGETIALPPLRLDDVVTIFRSVYLHGEGPTVTIDPNPEDPRGSAMIIRHSKATENTYVG